MTLTVDIALRRSTLNIAVSFTAAVGVTALFGASGAGKTSVLNMIAGVLTPTEGRIAAEDAVLFDKSAGISLAPPERRVGYVFQDGRLFPQSRLWLSPCAGVQALCRAAGRDRAARPRQPA